MVNSEKKILEYIDNIDILSFSKILNISTEIILDLFFNYGFIFDITDYISVDLAKFIILQLCLDKKNIFKRNVKILKKKKINFIKYPVVTFVGHVDQGKTTLLDKLCNSSYLNSEVSGITQRINYSHCLFNNRKIILLDTPGHELFSSSRIISLLSSNVILFLTSFSDILTPSSINLFNNLSNFLLPIILVINKIDLDDFDYSENFLKNTCYKDFSVKNKNLCFISCKKNIGLDNLKSIIYSNFKEDFKINNLCSYGVILDSYLDKNKSIIATIMLKNGSICLNDVLLCGYDFCKIKFIISNNKRLNTYNESLPVKIGFFSNIINIGLDFVVLHDKKTIDKVICQRKIYKKKNDFILLKESISYKDKKFIFLIKADTKILYDILSKLILNILGNDVKIIKSGIGDFTYNDYNISVISNSNILLFNTNFNKDIKCKLDQNKINYNFFNNIYDVISFLEKKKEENKELVLVGEAVVKNIFKLKLKMVAGCFLNFGKIHILNKVKIFRDKICIFEGQILSLKKFKKEVENVFTNEEFGIVVKDFLKFKIGDICMFYKG